jgi:hypothetical protein
MGKNSLIKSTDKKKKAAKAVEDDLKKEKAGKKEATKPAKTAPPTKSAMPEKTAAPDKVAAPEKVIEPPIVPKEAPAPPVVKKTIQELKFQKFEPIVPQPQPIAVPVNTAKYSDAPPIITATDASEIARIRRLLTKSFDMAEVIAAAVAPAEIPKPVSAPPVQSTLKVEMPPEVESAAPKTMEQKTVVVQRKAPEEIKPVVTRVEPVKKAPSTSTMDPVKRYGMYAAAGFALLLVLLIGASAGNSGKYYLKAKDSSLEIWRGRFSPTGKAFFLVLHDVQPPQEIKSIYTREEVFPFAFAYYLEKADSLLDSSGTPDYDGMKKYLNTAMKYAVSAEMNSAVTTRLHSIERMPLLLKADVAISKGTPESLTAALEYLKQAKRLASDGAQSDLVAQKITAVQERLAAITANASAKK